MGRQNARAASRLRSLAVARVLVTRALPEGGLDPLLATGHELVQREGDDPYTQAELVAAVADVDAVVCILTDRIDAAVLRAGAPRLRVVANVAVGYDNIDVVTAAELGIAVCNTPGVLDETTADLAFLLLLAAARRASDAEADLRQGRWTGFHIGDFLGVDVHGATLGVVGYGRIGQAVARRAAGFGMEVLHHSRHDTGIRGWVAELDDLLPRVDFVSLHVPLKDATRGLVDARRLGLMKRSAVLVNTARGPVVDEEALAVALEDGTIFAAGIDVYEREPEVHPRLLAAPHAVLLPHIGSATGATRRRMVQLAAEGAVAVLRGDRPPNIVTP
jgi:glyoxylate reductase